MLIRIAAITFIFFCTSVAWFILGATVEHRSSAPVEDLKSKVANTWGSPHEQKPPTACYFERVTRIEKSTENGKAVERYVEEDVCRLLPLDNSGIVVDLDLEHRQKGLLWFSTKWLLPARLLPVCQLSVTGPGS